MKPVKINDRRFRFRLILLLSIHLIGHCISGQSTNDSLKVFPIKKVLANFVDITDYTSIYVDSFQQFSIKKNLQLPATLPLTQFKFDKQNANYVYWLRLSINSQAEKDTIQAVFKFPVLDSITLFQVVNNKIVAHYQAGLLSDNKQSNVDKSAYYLPDKYGVPIEIYPNQQQDFFFCIKNQIRFHFEHLPIKLYNRDFETRERSTQLNYYLLKEACFFAILLFVILFSLIQYFANKEISYFYYSGYLMLLFIYYIWKFEKSNSFLTIFFNHHPEWYYYWEIPLVSLIFLTYVLFLQHFLDNAFRNSFFDNVIKYCKYFSLTYCLFNFIIIYQYGFDISWQIYVAVRIFYLVVFTFMLRHLLKRENRSELSFYIFMGTFILIISAILTLAMSINFRILNFFGFQQHFIGPWDIPLISMQIGILLEVLFFSLGLSVKSQLNLKNKNKLLSENQSLQKEANQKLELQLQLEKEAKEKSTIQEALIQAELKTLRNQLKPHFIYNCFTAILNFMEKQESEQAIKYLKQFSELLGYVLELSEHSTISLKTELDVIKNYISLEQMRFPNKFTFESIVDSTINLEQIMLPPLISQPFVENAIKHGLLPKEENRLLEIGIKRIDALVQLSIEDNGLGREQSLPTQKSIRKGRGIKNSRDRIALFNEKNKTNIAIDIIDKINSNGQPFGTIVLLNIPIQNS